ncbi:peptide deformylase [Thiohalobacter sp. COW1]|uniref:Peptide deformylase n=1 Tax=Thiohalobacter thiocyanaticus TaxID=585455 RepID=A0A1Z4VTN6_9GAMM|nr:MULTISPECIES: peptide deformylase [Thiohalobacter]BAZ95000.1 N-formylmethionyl-tRNA deformylase [Thiohalobacter thiocyanaticus]BCO33086.1 peptide deformylase [Thiohalobacter sp. COW1]
MAVFDILTYPDERLKQVSEPVAAFDQSLRDFIADLEQTRRTGPGAVGIAAPQVGQFIRVVIVDVSQMKKPVPNHGYLVLVNPEITEWEGYALGREGCLSVPDYTGNVIRAERVHLEACDPDGNPLTFDMEGFEARAVQHEMDHLDGLLFLDRLVSRRNDLFRRKVYKKS